MLKKIVAGILLVTLIGAGSAAYLYQAPVSEVQAENGIPDLLNNTEDIDSSPVSQPLENGGIDVPAAQGSAGEPWEAAGIITAVDDYGFDLLVETGETVYVELGPPTYWQTRGVELAPGIEVMVQAAYNEGMIHAFQLQLMDGQTLRIRTADGQPLWSGGVDENKGNGSTDGTRSPSPQAQVDEWVTISGTLVAYQGSLMTIAAENGDLINFQTGQPRFFASQNVSFQVGEEVIVVGFYEGAQFVAGDITQVATNLRVMLRDPNGRPLWAGPSNGNGNGKGGGDK